MLISHYSELSCPHINFTGEYMLIPVESLQSAVNLMIPDFGRGNAFFDASEGIASTSLKFSEVLALTTKKGNQKTAADKTAEVLEEGKQTAIKRTRQFRQELAAKEKEEKRRKKK
jgi:hypothetical protein